MRKRSIAKLVTAIVILTERKLYDKVMSVDDAIKALDARSLSMMCARKHAVSDIRLDNGEMSNVQWIYSIVHIQ